MGISRAAKIKQEPLASTEFRTLWPSGKKILHFSALRRAKTPKIFVFTDFAVTLQRIIG
jgi:hypothetical protein